MDQQTHQGQQTVSRLKINPWSAANTQRIYKEPKKQRFKDFKDFYMQAKFFPFKVLLQSVLVRKNDTSGKLSFSHEGLNVISL
jgi:hypothetical protein